MCNCNYRNFFEDFQIDEIQLLKEELANYKVSKRIPNGMSPEDYQIFKNIQFSSRLDRLRYMDSYRKSNNQCLTCGDPAKENPDGTFQIYCEKHTEQYRLRVQSKRQARRESGLCTQCGNPAKTNPDGSFQPYCKKHAEEERLRVQSKRQARKQSGLCIICGNPAKTNSDGSFHAYCEKHIEEYTLKVQARKQSGLCTQCGNPAKENPDGTFQTYCEKHTEQYRLRVQSRHQSRKQSRLCIICGNPSKTNSDGTFQIYCEKHTEQYRLKANFRHQARKRDAIDYKGGKCIKCDYDKSQVAMDFHHRDPNQKDKKWSYLRTRPIEKLKDELDKCDLVCKNCHRKLHFRDLKRKGDQRSRDKKQACLDYKKTDRCSKCSIKGINVIYDFHHIDPSSKDKNFDRYKHWPEWRGWIVGQELPQRVKDELDKCEVLCANCHAQEHWDPTTDETTDEFDKEIPEEECTDDSCKHSH
jgi:hypothetical protein